MSQKIDLKNVKITVLGAGLSGIAAAKLASYIGATVFISEKNDSAALRRKLSPFQFETNGHTKACLEADLLILSPGIPASSEIVQEFKSAGIQIVSEIEFASWFTEAPILAITGSNGKTTTTALLADILKTAGVKTYLGGNIGVPFSHNVLSELQAKGEKPVHVVELSSFQLEQVYNFCPEIACILNISPDHLDRYESMQRYIAAKLNITGVRHPAGWVVYNGHDPYLRENIRPLKNHIPFSSIFAEEGQLFVLEGDMIVDKETCVLFRLTDTKLLGRHNADNILAAMTMAAIFGIPQGPMIEAITKFKPIEHRLEFAGEIDSVQYFNDSKATNIEATAASITSFKKNVVLILGGQDKGKSDFRVLIAPMQDRVSAIVTYGAAGQEIADQLKDHFPVIYVKKFEDCFRKSTELVPREGVVLLAPACASYDQFENFEKRGLKFKSLVDDLKRMSYVS
ncbi:MAG: UDP-N-acetylmuramoyl-L-alanine--D-glutamate ligase [FCB group bacterium]|nr:UDP-N-acetylmuramoyl-L-alanine--D-glutamate ligase [FCB group bacterium]